MRSVVLPLGIVMAPQIALSAVQTGIPVLAPAIILAIGLQPEAVGLIGGLMGFGAVWLFAANRAVTPVLGPWQALVVACALAVIGAAMILTGLMTFVLAGAVVVGFAYAISAPAGSQILSQHTPKALWGTIFSLRQSGVPIGGAFAGLVGAGLAEAYGWRVGLAVLAIVPLTCGCLLLLAPGRFRVGTNGEPFRARPIFDPRNARRPFQTLRELPQLRPVTIASLGFAAGQGTFFSFLTTYLTDSIGLSLALAGLLFSIAQVASFGGRIAAGVVADAIGSTRFMLVAMAVASSLALILIARIDPGWPRGSLYVCAAIAGVSTATWNGIFLAEIARLVPAERVSEATASSTFFTFVAYMIAPPLFGTLVWLGGYFLAYHIIAVLVLTAAFAFIATPRSAPVESGDS